MIRSLASGPCPIRIRGAQGVRLVQTVTNRSEG
jgi:hypothetical protein